MEIENAPFRLASLGTSPASGGGKQPDERPAFSSPVYGGGGSHERSECETVGGMAEQVVAIARSWIGTPYVHQASLKHMGCDCLGLLRGIWRELYGEEPEETPPYSLDWAEATGAETLHLALNRHAREIAVDRLAPGDIALFRMAGPSRATASLHERSRGPAKHCGVVASRSPRPHACGGEGPGVKGFRNSEATSQQSKQVREHLVPASDFRSLKSEDPLTLNPSPPLRGGEGRHLTLIHARQNKRVSEEPFSAFWRGKLAFAFRI